MNQRQLRLLFLVAGAVVFFDTVFYAAVVPLLPTLTRQLHLTKASAGVLTAGYAAGTLVGSLPGGMIAERAGPRVTLYTGLALMGGGSLGAARVPGHGHPAPRAGGAGRGVTGGLRQVRALLRCGRSGNGKLSSAVPHTRGPAYP